MSLVTDILDRLSGVAVVKTELAHTAQRIDKLGEVVFNHETRIARLEGALAAIAKPAEVGAPERKRLPK
ncbi:MAG: hypothetical protein ACK6DI_12830 [Betaproteobacteria bacterium]|jgi:hypothetical protein